MDETSDNTQPPEKDQEAEAPPQDDLEKILEERARLESSINDKFTRTITVVFTDLKGSTAIAENEGDLVSRMLIKYQNDILLPAIQENKGTFV